MSVAVLGFGKSGQAVYRLLKRKGYSVEVFDDRITEINQSGFFFGKKAEVFFKRDYDFVVTSPGIKPSHRFIQSALERGMEVISELELASRYAKKPIIGITGTNGKTTTVKLVESILNTFGFKALACGNCGVAFSEVVDIDAVDFFVVEASSFQLEFTKEFKPHVAAILNIDFDHLYWHGNMENYINAKRKIFKNQNEGNYFLKNDNDNYVVDSKSQLLIVSRNDSNADAHIGDNSVVVNFEKQFIIDKTRLFGLGNWENIAFATLICLVLGVDKKTIREVVREMDNLEHRIEYVTEIDGVKFYNDSKATNLDAVENALKSFEKKKNIVLILGGKHKGESYRRLLPLLEEYVRAIVVYGEDRKQILQEIGEFNPMPLPAINIWGVVRGAFEVAYKDDVILFSPGGSSCEPYKNFEERGKDFKEEVFKFKEEYDAAPLV